MNSEERDTRDSRAFGASEQNGRQSSRFWIPVWDTVEVLDLGVYRERVNRKQPILPDFALEMPMISDRLLASVRNSAIVFGSNMIRNSSRKSPLSRSEIDALWMHAAGQLGFDVTRTDAAYATFDGLRAIAIGVPETLDSDDCVAQLVLHELCHALVEGDAGLTRVDWGLSNFDDADVSREYAALRLQAHLADAECLREAMAPTTSWRPYYEALAHDPMAGVDEAARIACAAIESSLYRRWVPTIHRALHETRTLLDLQKSSHELAGAFREASA